MKRFKTIALQKMGCESHVAIQLSSCFVFFFLHYYLFADEENLVNLDSVMCRTAEKEINLHTIN